MTQVISTETENAEALAQEGNIRRLNLSIVIRIWWIPINSYYWFKWEDINKQKLDFSIKLEINLQTSWGNNDLIIHSDRQIQYTSDAYR